MKIYSLLMLLAVMVAACGDNPVDHDNDDDPHVEADGLVLELGGVVVYRVLNRDVSCPAEPCGISVAAGAETGTISIDFLDGDGDPIHADDLEEEAYSLGLELADASVASFEQVGDWGFRIEGLEAGETALEVSLVHNDEHDDFKTPPQGVAIRVTEE